MKYPVALAQIVVAKRNSRGLSQRGLARRAHLGVGTIKAIEAGVANLSLAALELLGRALEMSLSDVLQETSQR